MPISSILSIIIIVVVQNKGEVVALDETLFIERFGSAKLPCETDDKPFLSGTNTVYWYKGTELSPGNLILVHSLTLDRVEYNEGYSDAKYQYGRDDHSLTVTNVDYTDEGKYRCESSYPDGVITSLIMLISNLTLPHFQENTVTSIQCRVSAVKPGVGSVVFTVTVDPDFSVQSSDDDLSEKSADFTTGAVSVTYSTQISLQRKHNGQQAVCTVVWRSKTVTSERKTVNVRFSATSINMTQLPSGLVPNDTDITFTCLTDEAIPTACVTWTVDGDSRNSSNDSIVDDDKYNALKRWSVFTLTVDQSLHNKNVKCVICGNTEVAAEETLNISYVSPPLDISSDTSNPVQAGVPVTFTCTLDANPLPRYSIWTSDGQSQEWVDVDSNNDHITLPLHKRHNKIDIFCRAEGNISGYPVDSGSKSFTVEFSATTINMTQSPSGPLSENTEVTFTCVTDEAEPTADVVWTVDGNTRSSDNDSTEDGMYNAQMRSSVLTVRVNRTQNNKKVECRVSGMPAINDTTTLNVTYPPDVTVQNKSGVIVEGSEFFTNCQVLAGNPEALTTQYWEFEPKYDGTQSQALPMQRENRDLTINRTLYSDAGTYRCIAGNTVGVDTGEIQIVVQYAPKLLKTNDSLIFFSELDQNVTLILTVRALPGLMNVSSAFTWYFVNRSTSFSPKEVNSTQLGLELFQSVLDNTNVDEKDYGVYIATVGNGIGSPVNFSVILKEKGPPEAARQVSITAKASEQAVLTWRSGLTGGFVQKFQLVLKNKSNEWVLDTHYNTSSVDELFTFKLNNLKPETPYSITIVSINEYNGYSETESKEVNFSTRRKPSPKDLFVEFTESKAKLSWTYDATDTNDTTLIIEQCNTTGDCVQHNVTNNIQQSLEVHFYDGDKFYLVVYQDGIVAYRSEEITERYENTTPSTLPGDTNSNPVIAIVAALCAITLIAVVVVVVVLFLRRRKKKENKDYTSQHVETEYEHTRLPLVSPIQNIGEKDSNRTDKDSSHDHPMFPAKPVLPAKTRDGEHSVVHLFSKTTDLDSRMERNTGNGDGSNPPPIPRRTLDTPAESTAETEQTVKGRPHYDNIHKTNSDTRILQTDFASHYAKMMAERKFKEEFDKLPAMHVHPITMASDAQLKNKNRFKNMLPYDDNRIILSTIDGDPLSSYINASYIKGYNGNVSYIATMGCTPDTVNDFWRMMWEQQASVVVMVTNIKEKGRKKCEKYWPDQNTSKQYGSVNVKLEILNIYPDYEIKHFAMEKDGETRPVSHYHYTGWPDKDVPKTAAAILKIRDHIKQHRVEGREPIVVHCSAGVGRTGTFICIDYLLDQVEVEGVVDVVICTRKLREQRFYMIQTVDQYRFVYQVMNEAIAVGNTALPCSDLGKTLFTLIDDGSLERQFQVLQVSKPVYTEDEIEFATMLGNDRKNRYPDILPADENRVVLNSFVEDYINAVFVDGYKSPRSFIATQIPMDFTVATFWRMMMDERCTGIICLQTDPDDTKWYPKENSSMVFGPFLVQNTGGKRKEGILISDVTVGIAPETEGTYANVTKQSHLLPWDKDDKHTLKVFNLEDWTKKPVRQRKISMLRSLYTEIQQWQQKCEKKRVTIMCLNGADECGLTCAAFSLFDMANTEQEVDIFNLVKQIRLARPQFITSADQYTFLHEAVQEYISQFGTYSNFR